MDSLTNGQQNWRFSSLCCLALPHMALLSIQATSPERRFTQKEIIAGEERPKYLLIKQHQDANATPATAGTGTNSNAGKCSLHNRREKNNNDKRLKTVGSDGFFLLSVHSFARFDAYISCAFVNRC